jgi:AcrR family transcriptional regulator
MTARPDESARSSASSAPGAWDRRRERVSRDIERVALKLFAQSSPEQVTAEQISAAAGISNRTFFRYFASRDDVLAAVPQRELARLSEQVRARPSSESIIEAFSAAGRTRADPDDGDLVLLWGIVVHRSPDAAAKALGQSTVGVADLFQVLIAERLGLDDADPRAGALGAALAGMVGFTYRRWVQSSGTGPLGDMLAEAFDSLGDLHITRPEGEALTPAASVTPAASRPKRPRAK